MHKEKQGIHITSIRWKQKKEERRMNQESINDLRKEKNKIYTVGRENENRTKLVLELRSN